MAKRNSSKQAKKFTLTDEQRAAIRKELRDAEKDANTDPLGDPFGFEAFGFTPSNLRPQTKAEQRRYRREMAEASRELEAAQASGDPQAIEAALEKGVNVPYYDDEVAA